MLAILLASFIASKPLFFGRSLTFMGNHMIICSIREIDDLEDKMIKKLKKDKYQEARELS